MGTEGGTYQLNLPQEGINLLPPREDALLLFGEVDRHGSGLSPGLCCGGELDVFLC